MEIGRIISCFTYSFVLYISICTFLHYLTPKYIKALFRTLYFWSLIPAALSDGLLKQP
ncbi:hypothetical protein NEIFLAOT_01881 [Neisseria flavescens NRL30031/H210]|uniref:Uncharacterized protein n=1 Tax=Neisseria flavescens NRL30031/H210 TaxID=546264 RepID=C0EPJ1_NEIFL|nr:hypothetical protein NEIFLAOT_01881 [Neisseria flavescens NRL30031/H210]